VEGEVEVEVEWVPRPNYARDDVRLRREGSVVHAESQREPLWLVGLPEEAPVELAGAAVRATVRLRAGERLDLVSGMGDRVPTERARMVRRYLDETLAWWDAWAGACGIAPGAERWREMILRSGMVLKLLSNEESGAIAAAPTTSLPEELGGIRNWDYRFCWVRDASLITRALTILGQRAEGVAFLHFLERAARQHRDPARIQVLYGLQGETRMPEYELGHLDGYRDSRPVRSGNAAALQCQLDVYGELLEAAHGLLRIGARFNDEEWAWLRRIADYVCDVWREKDRGIWELRGPEMHLTYSKLMCWVALDRSLRIARVLGWSDGTERWRRERAAIRHAILENAYDERRNTFVQSFSNRSLDASSLLIPLTGFLPAGDPRVQGTIDATLRELTDDGLVHRYRTDETADGVGGGEGAFGICTFWLADALALSGRTSEAREIFEAMLGRANDVGLFAEEIDPRSGEFLGNFPQAFTHVGLITCADFLARAADGEIRAPGDPEPSTDGDAFTEMAGGAERR
jgi:GH15 family glucan-1,4-alpha-glucosidase